MDCEHEEDSQQDLEASHVVLLYVMYEGVSDSIIKPLVKHYSNYCNVFVDNVITHH